MLCERCRGACCETLKLGYHQVRFSSDAMRWLALHGTATARSVELDCACTALDDNGRCSIYADRPQMCRAFEAGGAACLDTVRARRTPEEFQLIREDGDPEA